MKIEKINWRDINENYFDITLCPEFATRAMKVGRSERGKDIKCSMCIQSTQRVEHVDDDDKRGKERKDEVQRWRVCRESRFRESRPERGRMREKQPRARGFHYRTVVIGSSQERERKRKKEQ